MYMYHSILRLGRGMLTKSIPINVFYMQLADKAQLVMHVALNDLRRVY